MQAGQLRGIVVLPADFSRLLNEAGSAAPIQVIADGSEPNTARFVHAYSTGVWRIWRQNRMRDTGVTRRALIDLDLRYWYNPAAVSRNVIVPGALTIISTVIGAILTSLVIAREWERGTMEALLSTRVTRAELLLSKFIPYYLMGMLALAICVVVSVFVLGVPFRGSCFPLWLISSLFLANTLGMGLLISTLTRSQFNAAQIALNAAFLPAIMLSGFVFEIDSMPALVRAATYIIPARYYVRVMQTLFLAGNVPALLLANTLFLLGTATLFLGLTAVKTRLRLE
jgi:ABC-2 type transport system permease protein